MRDDSDGPRPSREKGGNENESEEGGGKGTVKMEWTTTVTHFLSSSGDFLTGLVIIFVEIAKVCGQDIRPTSRPESLEYV